MSSYDIQNEQDREDRRKHLELVSAVIGRMASASSTAKGWSITIAGAAFGVAVVRDSWYLFLLGIVGLIVFCIIDGLYLHNEKRFRDLYDAIVEDNSITPLSMDTSNLTSRPKNKSYLSWSVCGFYGPLIFAGVVLIIISLSNGGNENQEPEWPCPDARQPHHVDRNGVGASDSNWHPPADSAGGLRPAVLFSYSDGAVTAFPATMHVCADRPNRTELQ
ncbi:hypothetical protein CH289_18925 [Rhodococcus sp. RS1C4]|uniref:hypothetical protein n=1 Tax=Rhodococcus sp. 114MFTsu3.1 TaxID=1172184 RepID=UPI00037BB996|nr:MULTISPECIES: hypothetical protein [unclassified Rhodococcus (in: high G+C Gram-positive bacteria)]OZC48467.1 hypothetical protein CH289_18925 [Rhodococcus sp. RS1C4]